MNKVTIIGAGLTGCLLAVLLGRKGYQVEIYEKRDDPRGISEDSGRSICLTLCVRGLNILKKVRLEQEVYALSTPVIGRCIHLSHDNVEVQPYGNYGEALYSISRKALHDILIDTALKLPTVAIHFKKAFTQYDLSRSTITLNDNKAARFELLIGADGVYSKVRHQLKSNVRLNYSQYSNKELVIPAESAIKANLSRSHLHLWPRGEFMLLAFPKRDHSFICTLQLPTNDHPMSFQAINTQAKLRSLFNTLYPDVFPLIPNLEDAFFGKPEIPMVTVRCSSWHVDGKVALIGDAAHGIWPSYGQGMNAGFEDCDELVNCLLQHPNDTLQALTAYQKLRKINTDIIADLSENHFNELKHHVADSDFLIRKKIERYANLLFPSEYFCTYSRISFTTMPYSKAQALEYYDEQIINQILAHPEVRANPDSLKAKDKIYEIIISMRQKEQSVS
ncbi:FAD-dependent oxidoreductase [Legionella oakridgensis]|uniref:FAD-dependent oxidoreductase n=1 Tax=Legionella oakridgensis TaxID=29423 RepID=UPI0003DE2822|nr:NAD(P)/FAD-dependent oxidoreductase [Legionella oakridgensis]ETO92076.1 2-polyprenyl-6-methoxyphenol hydroxylase [Legionella oakridgensis RV-2-2007]